MTTLPDLEPAALEAAPKGYLFELCYSHEHDRWSGPMYSECLPDAADVRNVVPLYAARSVPEAGKAVVKPLAFLVRNPMVPRVMNAIPAAPLPEEWLYPARRENDAREFAKLMRADLVPLYSLGGSDEERA